jgi:type II secretory pathway component PulJ
MIARFPSIHRRAVRARRGMVLFEVIIALTIFTLVAFSLVMALNSAFEAAEDRDHSDEAVRGIQNQMALLKGAPVAPGDRDAPDDGSGIQYHIAVSIAQMQDQKMQPVPNILSATITATWQANGQSEQRSISELIYQP